MTPHQWMHHITVDEVLSCLEAVLKGMSRRAVSKQPEKMGHLACRVVISKHIFAVLKDQENAVLALPVQP